MAGLWADRVYERQYTQWRVNKRVPSGFNFYRLAGGCALLLFVFSLTLYRFTISQPDERIVAVPVPSAYHTRTANLLEDYFDHTARAGADLFNSIAGGTEAVLQCH